VADLKEELHLAGLEYLYLGGSFGYPAPEILPWVEDGST
jgi:hypothetical protein